MILTLTPSPSLDLNYELSDFQVGEVNRTTASSFVAGGKGINVSRILVKMGVSTKAIVPLRADQNEFYINASGLNKKYFDVIQVAGSMRFNLALLHRGETTKINAENPTWTSSETGAIAKLFHARARRSSFGVIGGSLPAGISPEWLAGVVAHNRTRTKMVVDCSGPALAEAINAKPFLVKPNIHEAEVLLGRQIFTNIEIKKACEDIVAMGATNVLLSLGDRGAVFFDGKEFWQGYAKSITVTNTVGAGDALLAGFIGGFRKSIDNAMASALAWSEAAILSYDSRNLIKPTIDLNRVRKVADGNLDFSTVGTR